MLPKKIHYCWFGRTPLPKTAQKCIASWRKYLPEYEIIEWNENNFDVNEIPYTAQAYNAGKFAFVSDYARFKVLYEQGGIYFDTDVEVIKPMNEIMERGPFMGVEVGICNDKRYRKYQHSLVAPGLGIAAVPGMDFYKRVLDHYANIQFGTNADEYNTTTVGEHVTSLLQSYGYKTSKEIQLVNGIYIYPPDWFNPLDDATGKLRITKNTVSIHWYTKSWLDNQSTLRIAASRIFHRIFGVNALAEIRRFCNIK